MLRGLLGLAHAKDDSLGLIFVLGIRGCRFSSTEDPSKLKKRHIRRPASAEKRTKGKPVLPGKSAGRRGYLQKYPDVRQAIAKKAVKDAKDHFVRFGYFEHRLPYRIEVKEEWYLEQYPDIKKAIDRRDFKSGQEHFETNGFREGRMPHPNFDLAVGENY